MSKPGIEEARKLAKFALEQQLGYYGIDSDDTKELSRAFLHLDAENAKLREELKAARNAALEDAAKICESALSCACANNFVTKICAGEIRAMKEKPRNAAACR